MLGRSKGRVRVDIFGIDQVDVREVVSRYVARTGDLVYVHAEERAVGFPYAQVDRAQVDSARYTQSRQVEYADVFQVVQRTACAKAGKGNVDHLRPTAQVLVEAERLRRAVVDGFRAEGNDLRTQTRIEVVHLIGGAVDEGRAFNVVHRYRERAAQRVAVEVLRRVGHRRGAGRVQVRSVLGAVVVVGAQREAQYFVGRQRVVVRTANAAVDVGVAQQGERNVTAEGRSPAVPGGGRYREAVHRRTAVARRATQVVGVAVGVLNDERFDRSRTVVARPGGYHLYIGQRAAAGARDHGRRVDQTQCVEQVVRQRRRNRIYDRRTGAVGRNATVGNRYESFALARIVSYYDVGRTGDLAQQLGDGERTRITGPRTTGAGAAAEAVAFYQPADRLSARGAGRGRHVHRDGEGAVSPGTAAVVRSAGRVADDQHLTALLTNNAGADGACAAAYAARIEGTRPARRQRQGHQRGVFNSSRVDGHRERDRGGTSRHVSARYGHDRVQVGESGIAHAEQRQCREHCGL